MTDKGYFEEEYNYLQAEGLEFAAKYPSLGNKLRLSERERKDPFVERMLEAFAFLAGRIHERLDDDFPEFTHGLMEHLFPQFLRPFPSCAILKATALPGSISKAVRVPRHSHVKTPPDRYKLSYAVSAGPEEKGRTLEKNEPVEFVFRTASDMTIRPLSIADTKVESADDGCSRLVLDFRPDREVSFDALDLGNVTLYLHGAPSMKYTLLFYLLNHLRSISVAEAGASATPVQNARIEIPELMAGPDDVSDDHCLLPYSRHAFTGYRILHEYFSFPEKFFFLNLVGLNRHRPAKDGPFSLVLQFDRKLPLDCRPSRDNVLLHCVPCVNLFDGSTEEVPVTQRLPEYHIIPDLDRRKSKEIYCVRKVTGLGEKRYEEHQYLPTSSYEVFHASESQGPEKHFFSSVRRENESDMAETHIRLHSTNADDSVLQQETLSIEATLSNGFLPSKYLQADSLTEAVNFPPGIKVTNITVPTDVLPVPQRKNFLWALISHLSMNFVSLAEADHLANILGLYNWRKQENDPNRKRIGAIRKVHAPLRKNLIHDQMMVRCLELEIEVDPGGFEHGEGDLYLFGLVLNRFLSQYATLNSFALVVLTDINTQKRYTWKPVLGKISPV